MSRSRKKHGIVKYGKCYTRQMYNKKLRCRNKQRIRMGKEPYLMRELINPYDVNDVISTWDERWYRTSYYGDGGRMSRMWTDEEIEELRRVYFNK